MFIKYNIKGINPDEKHVHWIQFVKDPTFGLFVDAKKISPIPYYDTDYTANATGFVDRPSQVFPVGKIRDYQVDFDLFVVQETAEKTVCIWQGLSWGFSLKKGN